MNENRDTNTDANMEQASSHEPLAKNENSQFDKRVCITVHSFRKRLADPDGISAKAFIDGVVKGGILQDDSAKFVEEVRYKQYKSKEEKTILEITEVE